MPTPPGKKSEKRPASPTRGGRRQGAGRPRRKTVRVVVRLHPETITLVEEERYPTRSQAIEVLILEALHDRYQNRRKPSGADFARMWKGLSAARDAMSADMAKPR